LLVLYNGQTLNETDGKISNFRFSESDFNFNNLNSNTITTIKTQETSTIELFKCLNDLNKFIKTNKDVSNLNSQNCSIRNINNIYTEIYKRIIVPIYIPILIILSLLHIVKSKESINYFRYRVFIFVLGLSTIIFSETSLKLIEDDINSNIKLIVLPILLIFSSYFTLFYKLRFKIKNSKVL
jgi:lipopolysaccharide export system permease protein